jgi:peptidyl-Lys metalloendopeptidase
VPQPVLRGDVDVSVEVSVTNVSRGPVTLLRWQLPGDDLEGALFRITDENGRPVRYVGPLIKRGAPEAADHVRLQPGETLNFPVELTATYDLSRNGRYAIEYLGRAGRAGVPTLQSDPAYVWLEGRSAKTASVAPLPAAKSLSTLKCSATQQGQIATAVTDATTYAAGAQSYLGSKAQGARYTTWFGTYDATRYATVTAHFDAIKAAFDTAAITVDCSCKKPNVYAFVYPDKPYVITVCGAFWKATATGTDSKAGTLIHEMSHFNAVASTDDWAYGQTNAKALAISDPTKAIDNADSHEYFAENTPALP